MAEKGLRQRSTPKALINNDEELSLRERLRKHYRDHPPNFTVKKEDANRYGVAYFIVMVFLESYLLGWQIIPHLIEPLQLIYWRLLVYLIAVETFYNWFHCCRKYVNKVEKRSEDGNKNETVGWKLCAICQYYTPPRSHHCKLCKACILRQDHHCYFTAGCIGHFTTPYFIFMSFWMLIGQLFVVYWMIRYSLVEFSNAWMYFPPTAFWASLTKSQPWFNSFLVLLSVFVLINIFTSTFYLVMGVIAASSNMTFYEGSRGIKTYKKSNVLANVRAALGSYYWIRWLIPIGVAPEGDGYEWTISKHSL